VKNSLTINLSETIISSFFFHLILFLLIIGVSAYTTRISGHMPKIISVDLAAQDTNVPPAVPSVTEDRPSPVSTPPSDKQMSLPDQAATLPEKTKPEETRNTTEPEKKAEPAPGPAKVEEAAKPAVPKEGYASLEDYLQFVMLHKKIFRQHAGTRVNELLGEAFKVNKREFYGGSAIVSLLYGPDGKLTRVLVNSTTPELKAFLEEIGWDSLPSPAAYSLRYTGVQIEFTVLEGYMSFNINAL
jgi:hypothetical protein